MGVKEEGSSDGRVRFGGVCVRKYMLGWEGGGGGVMWEGKLGWGW